MKHIYAVVTIKKDHSDQRVVGWFPTKERAEKIVLGNYGDIYECGWYPFVVIEEVYPGLYPVVETKFWFKWYKRSNTNMFPGYKLIKTPKQYRGMDNCGLSMG
jgi:hypothetical protein